MKIFRFLKRVSTEGTIQLKLNTALINKEVEIIVLPKEEVKRKPIKSNFIKKWAGFLKDNDVEDARFKYLMEKYK